MFLILYDLHLLLNREVEKLLALCKNLIHKFLADSMIDNIEKPTIQASLVTKNQSRMYVITLISLKFITLLTNQIKGIHKYQ